MASLLGCALLIGGFFFLLVGTLGLLRLPDTYTRLHATGKCDTLGSLLTILGCMIMARDLAAVAKLLAIAVFIWIVNPATAHMIARVARATGVPMTPATVYRTRGEQAERGAVHGR